MNEIEKKIWLRNFPQRKIRFREKEEEAKEGLGIGRIEGEERD